MLNPFRKAPSALEAENARLRAENARFLDIVAGQKRKIEAMDRILRENAKRRDASGRFACAR
ncbi:hypothetical protein AA103196_3117 [Ameyamaea chiangmaiensis NBRC 103196]|uniref:Uncharacterized protein n=1 Tax=Ameyamaea chiangmaiensis TaxID=442969 RepID=A0A850P9K1_9PROT|nr:hypothetical protein [Ameyamaea chiangmaiensis]MBS4074603.1 hypothetical protein [Ameyamaea chiangmaiensis]NVN39359.1 hypothetical protein [Ameyamaea chiangmaiensis]GBQ72635.1 hypothetical protein AA103196_3117 [Ameyamaea chiangmaiensis NBRC 103196]